LVAGLPALVELVKLHHGTGLTRDAVKLFGKVPRPSSPVLSEAN